MIPSKEQLIAKAQEKWRTNPDNPKLLDIRIAGSYCYNYHTPDSDLDVVLVVDLPEPVRGIRSLGYCVINDVHVAFNYISYLNQTPNWGPFTLPQFSLLTGELYFYDRQSIIAYLTTKTKFKQTNRLFDDHYGTGINLASFYSCWVCVMPVFYLI